MKRYADSTVRKAARRMYGTSGLTVEPTAEVQRTSGGGYFVHALLWVNYEHVPGLSRDESEAKS